MEIKGKYNKDCKIFSDDIEDEALSLIYRILDEPAFANAPIRIMPDTHAGKGIVIGFTAPVTNMVCPSHVGVDIGCTITTYITDTALNKNDYSKIEEEIKTNIPMGFKVHDTHVFRYDDMYAFIKEDYLRAKQSWPDMINDFDVSEHGISQMLRRIKMDEGLFYRSIGSVGGGNHFIEIGDYNGKYAFSVHCGSRNFGNVVCKYWEKMASSGQIDNKIFKAEIEKLKAITINKHELPHKIKVLKEELIAKQAPNGYLTGENMKGYLTDMVIAQSYARFNHLIIGKLIENIFHNINGASVIDVIQSTHNYIDVCGDHMIRKGAIRAYEGEKMVVPFNMRDGLAICIGKSNSDWNNSCSHGAGRKMSRSEAKKNIDLDSFKKSMDGIYTTSVGFSTIDEAPMAYKDTDTIINKIKDTCDILYMVKPVINIKSSDSIYDVLNG